MYTNYKAAWHWEAERCELTNKINISYTKFINHEESAEKLYIFTIVKVVILE